MTDSFLPAIHNELDDIRRAASRHGGFEESDGRGLPNGDFGHFAFATRVECSAPVITGSNGRDLRRDLLEKCAGLTNVGMRISRWIAILG